jgi:hypothetical protein
MIDAAIRPLKSIHVESSCGVDHSSHTFISAGGTPHISRDYVWRTEGAIRKGIAYEDTEKHEVNTITARSATAATLDATTLDATTLDATTMDATSQSVRAAISGNLQELSGFCGLSFGTPIGFHSLRLRGCTRLESHQKPICGFREAQ